MSDAGDSSPNVMDILRLSTTLAEEMVRSQDLGSTLSDEQLTMLVRAARFLHDRNVPWPPPLQKAIENLAVQMEAIRATLTDAAPAEELTPL